MRESKSQVTVIIRDDEKPEVSTYVKDKWQNIINLVADLLNVPAGLIMEISKTHMNVFLRSENEENPYPSDGKDTLLHGLYCETVIGSDKALVVEDSLQSDAWKDNPDVALNMISYYGLPLKWADGTFFGTICALDNKANQFHVKFRKIMGIFKDIIEQDLALLERNQALEISSDYDALTKVYNRRKFDEELTIWLDAYKRYGKQFSLIFIDINAFKHINDFYGHNEGDKVLRNFADVFIKNKRKTDYFFRYGGDEFAILSHIDNKKDIELFMLKMSKEINDNPDLKKYFITFSYGASISNPSIEDTESMIVLSDKNMYIHKKKLN